MTRWKLPPLPPRKAPPKLPPSPHVICKRSTKNTVKCAVDYTYQENESGNEQECVVVECSECERTEQSWGHGDKSVRRCLVLMGENCPEGGDNFYILERD